MQKSPVYFLLHVPKCAGTTVEDHFTQHLGSQFLMAPRWKSVWRNVFGNRYQYGENDPHLSQIRAVSGHSLSANLAVHFPGREIRQCVLLRDPESYFLSFWNYRLFRHRNWGYPAPPEFAVWYDVQRKNPITRFILNRYFGFGVPALYRLSSRRRLEWLEDQLAQFWFVGGIKHTSDMIAQISDDLGINQTVESRNVGEYKRLRPGDLDQSLRARILDENMIDQVIFDRWGDCRWNSSAKVAETVDLPRMDQLPIFIRDVRSGLMKNSV